MVKSTVMPLHTTGLIQVAPEDRHILVVPATFSVVCFLTHQGASGLVCTHHLSALHTIACCGHAGADSMPQKLCSRSQ